MSEHDEDFDDDDEDFYDDYYEGDVTSGTNMKLSTFNNYRSNNVSWIIEYKDSKGETQFDHWEKQGCYGTIASLEYAYKGKELVAIYTSLLVSKRNDDLILPYWDFLFDKDKSPWRKPLFPNGDIEFVTHKTSETPYLKLPLTKTTSAQALVSFFIAARLGVESHSDNLLMFKTLLDKGWSEHEAFYTSIYLGLHKVKDIYTVTNASNYDWYAFCAKADNRYDWLVNSTPRLITKNVFPQPYGRLQDIWLDKDFDYGQHKASIYEKLVKIRKYDGVFPKRFERLHSGSKTMPITMLPPLEEILEKKKEIFANVG